MRFDVRFEELAGARAARLALEQGGSRDVKILAAKIGPCVYNVIRSRDCVGLSDFRWHVSVSGQKSLPPWGDMVAISHALFPDLCFVIGVPPKAWWINVHPYCLHLWELQDRALLSQWQFESLGQEPT